MNNAAHSKIDARITRAALSEDSGEMRTLYVSLRRAADLTGSRKARCAMDLLLAMICERDSLPSIVSVDTAETVWARAAA